MHSRIFFLPACRCIRLKAIAPDQHHPIEQALAATAAAALGAALGGRGRGPRRTPPFPLREVLGRQRGLCLCRHELNDKFLAFRGPLRTARATGWSGQQLQQVGHDDLDPPAFHEPRRVLGVADGVCPMRPPMAGSRQMP